MRIRHSNTPPASVNQGASPRTTVRIHLNPGEKPGAIDYVVEASRVLKKGIVKRDITRSDALEVIGLMNMMAVTLQDGLAPGGGGWGCAPRDLRRECTKLSQLAERCKPLASNIETREYISLVIGAMAETLNMFTVLDGEPSK